jgi:hypothetical protein
MCKQEGALHRQTFMSSDHSTAAERWLAMMKAVCNKPGLYVGSGRMRLVRAFLDGYSIGLFESGAFSDSTCFGGFAWWLQRRHGICHPAWGWDRILVHAAGSEEEAIRTLPAVFAEYRSELERGTFTPGSPLDWTPEPEETCTHGYNDFPMCK